MRTLLIGENKYGLEYTHTIPDGFILDRYINYIKPRKIIKGNVVYTIKQQEKNFKDWHLFIVSGASCIGKSTCIRRLLVDLDYLKFVTTTTTRNKRASEVEGVSYHYINKLDFVGKIVKDEFEEYNLLFNAMYGLTKKSLATIKNNNFVGITDMDIEGSLNLKSKYPNNITVIHFIVPTTKFRKEIVDRMKTMKNRNTYLRSKRITLEETYGRYAEYRLYNKKESKTVQVLKQIIRDKSREWL